VNFFQLFNADYLANLRRWRWPMLSQRKYVLHTAFCDHYSRSRTVQVFSLRSEYLQDEGYSFLNSFFFSCELVHLYARTVISASASTISIGWRQNFTTEPNSPNGITTILATGGPRPGAGITLTLSDLNLIPLRPPLPLSLTARTMQGTGFDASTRH